MKRPNKYHIHEVSGKRQRQQFNSYNNGEYELFRGLENKFTGERVEVK